jgi:predicted alpha/beta-hydrolase family hydrolase
MADAKPLTIAVEGARTVSALLDAPKGARAGYVVAHGAGVGMHHKFMAATAMGLAGRGIAVLRYQFPYMEAGSKRPDSSKVAQATVRAACAEAARLMPKLPLVAGGKSYGGRMTSGAQASQPMPGVMGLAFLGFPLHAPGQPSDERAAHLFEVKVPMLLLQGTRDEFAQLDLLKQLVKKLGKQTSLQLFDGADHSFHVPKSSGRTDADVMEELLDTLAAWIDRVCENRAA